MALNPFKKLLTFLSELERRKIHFKLAWIRDQAIMVEITVPGERWEVEFFGDGQVEVEVFKSPGVIGGEVELERLLSDFQD